MLGCLSHCRRVIFRLATESRVGICLAGHFATTCLMGAAMVLAMDVVPWASAEQLDCWVPSPAPDVIQYSFEICCRQCVVGMRGDPRCWGEGFTYEVCCIPELKPQIERWLPTIHGGDLRAASGTFFDLYVNYMEPSGDKAARALAYRAFESAATKFRAALDDYPKALSYFEILFHGSGIECEHADSSSSWEPGVDAAPSAFAEFWRCCTEVDASNQCMRVFEMIAAAVGYKRKREPGGEDTYYRDFSEQWAFHHFTPSILLSSDVAPGEPRNLLEEAKRFDPDVAQALMAEAEPSLGIVWAEHADSYVSHKFCHAVYHLTVALGLLRVLLGSGQSLDVFEVGAGYGNYPRLLASARQRLLGLKVPIDVQRYVVFDVRSAIDLQLWYLTRTLGARVEISDWRTLKADNGERLSANRPVLAPLSLELVEREERDLFVHAYAQAQQLSADPDAAGVTKGPQRLLIAVNSWHEMPMSEYFWYHNTFIAGPAWHLRVGWVLYVANQEWYRTEEKQRLLLSPGPGYRFEVRFNRCVPSSCIWLLQRVP